MPIRTSGNEIDRRSENESGIEELRIDNISPTGTLRPHRRGAESGKFKSAVSEKEEDKKKYTVRDSIQDYRLLHIPDVGQALLRERDSWENLPAKVKELLLPEMLEFIARDPIPKDEEIESKINTIAPVAFKQYEVKKILAGNDQLPELIAVAINQHMIQEIMDNPAVSMIEIMEETGRLANEAIKRVHREPVERKFQAGRYCQIAAGVLYDRKIRKAKAALTGNENNNDQDNWNSRATIPDTPMAKKDFP
jgi:hypothetical protein